MVLRIVHVSDIHFHRSRYGWDANLDQREELVRDLEAQVADGGAVDAVLVGGDIAFSGHEHEYQIAKAWLEKLVSVCGGIGMDRVWTVPGNHDVNRDVLQDCMPAQTFREQLRELPHAQAVDEYLRQRLTVDPAADAFFEPLRAYNDFARPYMCHSSPGHPHWIEDRTLFLDDQPVHITGLNSSMNSDGSQDSKYRDPDGKRHLVFGTMQCQLSREGDPIHIVIAHHPPNWIRDWDVVAPFLRRGHVWIFGHEHEYKSVQDIAGGAVQLSGGAVGPERDADGEKDPYVPAYLLLTLSHTVGGDLQVHVQPRYWSMAETRFVEHPDRADDFVVERTPAVSAGVATSKPSTAAEDLVEPLAIAAASASPIADASPVSTEDSTSRVVLNLREIARRFGTLPPTKRVAIGLALNVLDEDDLTPGTAKDLDRLILGRVGERGLIEQLQAKVNS